MKKTEKIYLMLQRATSSKEQLQQEVFDWIVFLRLITTPMSYRLDGEAFENFELSILHHKIRALTESDQLVIEVRSDKGEFQLMITSCDIQERAAFEKIVFITYQQLIEDYCDTKMTSTGIYGYIRSLDEQLYNNVEIIDQRIFDEQHESDELPKRYNDQQQIIVDCNQLSGYDIYYQELCWTSCWRMYYSDQYFRIVPKEIFLEIQQVESLVELSKRMLRITLYKNPFNWQHPTNQSHQRLFRDQLGIDQLVWANGIGVLRPPFIEYAFSETTIQTVQYQNDHFQPVAKQEATYFVTRFYDSKQQNFHVSRTHGVLNAQAYFPWIDKKSQKMMNYRVVNPEKAIDNGLTAYEFYIRQFLEIDVVDPKYNEFVSILRFYLPKEATKTLPLEALWERLMDINISNLKQKDYVTRFDLKKAKNHLQVVFLEEEQLNYLNFTAELNE